MNENLSLFSATNEEEVDQAMNKQLQSSMSELMANRNSAMQKYAQEAGAVEKLEAVEEPKEAATTYKKEDIFPDVARYFGGDELAAGVWID